MPPVTPTSTTLPASLIASPPPSPPPLACPRRAHGAVRTLHPLHEERDHVDDILRRPEAAVQDQVIRGQVVDVDPVEGAVALPLAGPPLPEVTLGRLYRDPLPLRHPRGADGQLRPQPRLQVRVHHPSGQPALHDARSGAGQFGLHPIHLAVEVGILLRPTVQFQDGQTAPPRHLPEGLAGGEVAIPQPRRQRARHGALPHSDRAGDGDDHGSTGTTDAGRRGGRLTPPAPPPDRAPETGAPPFRAGRRRAPRGPCREQPPRAWAART